MIVRKLALIGIYTSSTYIAVSAISDQQQAVCFGCYKDVPAMDELKRVFRGNESSIPEALKKSIGSCKFTYKTGDAFVHGGEPKINGKPSRKIIARGTANPSDNCLYFTGIKFMCHASAFLNFD